jgi:hypothetical protein
MVIGFGLPEKAKDQSGHVISPASMCTHIVGGFHQRSTAPSTWHATEIETPEDRKKNAFPVWFMAWRTWHVEADKQITFETIEREFISRTNGSLDRP